MIILIAGKKRSGKDYVASLIKNKLEKYNYDVDIKSFADKLKEIAYKSLNISADKLEEYKNKEESILVRESNQIKNVTLYDDKIITNFRKYLQYLGDSLRDIDIDIFIKEIEKYYSQNEIDYLIVPDLRFDNEYMYLKYKYDIFTVLVKGGIDNDTHKSEQIPDIEYDYILDNTKKKELNIDNMIENIIKKYK